MPLRENLNNLFLELYNTPTQPVADKVLSFYDNNVNYIESKEIVKQEFIKELSKFIMDPSEPQRKALESYRTVFIKFIYKD